MAVAVPGFVVISALLKPLAWLQEGSTFPEENPNARMLWLVHDGPAHSQ